MKRWSPTTSSGIVTGYGVSNHVSGATAPERRTLRRAAAVIARLHPRPHPRVNLRLV